MSDTPDTSAKAPARPVGEIVADIERERSELDSSFESLRNDLDKALEAGMQKAKDVGKKAAVIGSVVGAVAVTAAAATLLLRRRSGKEH